MSKTEFIVLKGNKMVQTSSSKMAKVRLVAKFAELTAGAETFDGKQVYIITMPTIRGDRRWVHENVFAYTNMGTTGTDALAIAKAEKLLQIYDEKRGGKDMMCVDSVLCELDNMHALYEVREI